MDTEQAKTLVESQGYQVAAISSIPEGTGHENFALTLDTGDRLVARFEKYKERKGAHQHRDGQFGGTLSLEREAALCTLVKGKAGLPAPTVKGVYDTDPHFLLVEQLPGKWWKEYLEDQQFSFSAYVRSLEFLGADMAQAHTVEFPSYGNAMGDSLVDPPGITNFAKRLEQIIQLKLQAEEEKRALPPKEFQEVRTYFERDLRELEAALDRSDYRPILVLSDIHPTNFFVDDNGKPCGYYDLERCQAGVPSFEFFQIRMTMLAYFNEHTFHQAEEAFLRGYAANGGRYDQNDPTTQQLDRLIITGQMLTCVTAYHAWKDGIRDLWSEQFKELLFETITGREINYARTADIFRTKTKQPTEPTYP